MNIEGYTAILGFAKTTERKTSNGLELQLSLENNWSVNIHRCKFLDIN